MPTIPDAARDAWTRVKSDAQSDPANRHVFYRHPFLVEVMDANQEQWLPELYERWNSGNLVLSTCRLVEVPKIGEHVRPGADLSLRDQTYYHLAAAEVLPYARQRLAWSDGLKDFSYRLSAAPQTQLFGELRGGWAAFDRESIEALRTADFMVHADISGFYENISMKHLQWVLEEAGVPEALRRKLSTLLNAWAEPRDRGIPQGPTPSALLAKLFLDPIDRQLSESGLLHLRYADDIRLFCNSRHEARQAVAYLSRVLRAHGLNLQTGKTRILAAGEATTELTQVSEVIEQISLELRDEFDEYLANTDDYLDLETLEDLVQSHEQTLTSRSIEAAFRRHFVDSFDPAFDKRLFHFLLNRLRSMREPLALSVLERVVESRPEETKYVLQYCAALENERPEITSLLAQMLADRKLTYAYQVYAVLEWLIAYSEPAEGLVTAVRTIARDRSREHYVRHAAIVLLGKVGTAADLDYLSNEFADASADEQVTIAGSIGRMTSTRRNSLLARWLLMGQEVRWATARSRS